MIIDITEDTSAFGFGDAIPFTAGNSKSRTECVFWEEEIQMKSKTKALLFLFLAACMTMTLPAFGADDHLRLPSC